MISRIDTEPFEGDPKHPIFEARQTLLEVQSILITDIQMMGAYLSPITEGVDPKNHSYSEEDRNRLGAVGRQLLRTQMSYIEAISFQLKLIVLAMPSENLSSMLSSEDKIALAGIQVKIRNGKARKSQMKTTFLCDLEFCFNIFSKAFELPFALDKSGKGWQDLLSTIPVRDRLTHPKFLSGMNVTPDELISANSAFDWFNKQISSLLKLHTKHYF